LPPRVRDLPLPLRPLPVVPEEEKSGEQLALGELQPLQETRDDPEEEKRDELQHRLQDGLEVAQAFLPDRRMDLDRQDFPSRSEDSPVEPLDGKPLELVPLQLLLGIPCEAVNEAVNAVAESLERRDELQPRQLAWVLVRELSVLCHLMHRHFRCAHGTEE
jgi:hypothetical protein